MLRSQTSKKERAQHLAAGVRIVTLKRNSINYSTKVRS
jgi:hypothetical protein